MNYTISPAQARTVAYQQCLAEELRAGELSLAELERTPINHPLILKYKAKLLANRDHYDEYADWTAFLAETYSPRRNCLSLGSGLGRVEHYLIKKGFCKKIETIELCANINQGERLKDQRLDVLPGDLNFVSLPEKKYDFIICHGVLHHLINLEHLLDEINKSLTDDGLVLIYEYVGETRWQFTEQRRAFLQERFPAIRFSFPPRWEILGFESVRSGELLNLIQSVYGKRCERSVSYGGVYFPFLVSTTSIGDELLSEVLGVDAQMLASQKLSPCYHMGVYRKSNIRSPKAKVWSDNDVESNLVPKAPLVFALNKRLKSTTLAKVARNFRKVLSR